MAALRAVVLFCAAVGVSAGGFLHSRPHSQTHVSREAVKQTFEAALSMDLSLLQKFETELRPMYQALPKDARGTLEPAVVRYALHRYFVLKHGWHIKGLDGHATNTSSPSGILKDDVPEYVRSLLQEHVSGQGWSLHELAICCAALEELIKREFLQDLTFVYDMLQIPVKNSLGESELDDVVQVYLAQYLVEEDFDGMTPDALVREMRDSYSAWNDLLMWATDVRRSLAFTDRGNPFKNSATFSFEQVVVIIQEIMDQYTHFQNIECSAMTDVILDLEHMNTGRVPLAKFYQAGLQQKWKFWEPKEYLQHAGAVDETDARRPSVIIPNYVYGVNNCLASSSFFAVCCTNKCERLVGSLERTIAAPSAPPQRIAELVSQLASDTVDAPRNLSSSLLARLSEIAEHHGGEVPLHARLFSQWMHHAYPRECPFPHVDGESNPLTPEAWAESTGKDYTASDEEMRRHIREHNLEHDHHEQLPWMAKEKLVGSQGVRSSRSWMQKGMAMVAVLAIATPALRAWNAMLSMSSRGAEKQCKHLV